MILIYILAITNAFSGGLPHDLNKKSWHWKGSFEGSEGTFCVHKGELRFDYCDLAGVYRGDEILQKRRGERFLIVWTSEIGQVRKFDIELLENPAIKYYKTKPYIALKTNGFERDQNLDNGIVRLVETAYARRTDQGDAGVCTRHAIASAIADQVKWKTEGKVDLDERSIIDALMQKYDHADGIDPMAFNDIDFKASTADKKKWWYKVYIQIHHTTKMYRESAHNSKEIPGQETYGKPLCRSTCVITYPMNGVHKGNYDPDDFHCVYLRRFDSDANAWIGQNSWGNHEPISNIPYALENVEIHDVVVTKLEKVSQSWRENNTVVGEWKGPKHLEYPPAPFQKTLFWKRPGTVHIGIAGKCGVEKSTFINTIRGLKKNKEGAAKVFHIDDDEFTMNPTPYEYPRGDPRVVFWDLPGYGTRTKNFSTKKYLKDMGVLYFNYMILMTDRQFMDGEIKLMNTMTEYEIPFAMVCGRVDKVEECCEADEESFDDVQEEIRNKFAENGIQRIFLISNFLSKVNMYDFPTLVRHINENVKRKLK